MKKTEITSIFYLRNTAEVRLALKWLEHKFYGNAFIDEDHLKKWLETHKLNHNSVFCIRQVKNIKKEMLAVVRIKNPESFFPTFSDILSEIPQLDYRKEFDLSKEYLKRLGEKEENLHYYQKIAQDHIPYHYELLRKVFE